MSERVSEGGVREGEREWEGGREGWMGRREGGREEMQSLQLL